MHKIQTIIEAILIFPFVFNSSSSHSGLSSLGDAAVTPDSTAQSHSTPTLNACLSSDEGENEEREESMDRLDCHYSGYHPRPAAVSTSRVFGPSVYWSLRCY